MSLDPGAIAALLSAFADLPTRIAALERGQAELAVQLARIGAAMPPTLLTVPEAAAAAKVSVPTMRRWIKAGSVATVRIGNTVRVDLARLAGVNAQTVAQLARAARSA